MTTLTTPTDVYNFVLRSHVDLAIKPSRFISIALELEQGVLRLTSPVETAMLSEPSLVTFLDKEFGIADGGEIIGNKYVPHAESAFNLASILKRKFAPIQASFELELTPITHAMELALQEFQDIDGPSDEPQVGVMKDGEGYTIGLQAGAFHDAWEICEETGKKLVMLLGGNTAKYSLGILEGMIKKNKHAALLVS